MGLVAQSILIHEILFVRLQIRYVQVSTLANP